MSCPVCLQQPHQPRRLQPCGHELCSECYQSWSKACHGAPTCPVCRADIDDAPDAADALRIQTALSNTIPKFEDWCSQEHGPERKQHQVDGVTWCLKREVASQDPIAPTRGGLICDEMGLGKTIIIIGLIMSNFLKRTLIVLPPVLIPQWVEAFQKFCGHTPLVYHGARRHLLPKDTLQNAPIVLTSYHTLAIRTKSSETQDGEKEVTLSPLHSLQWDRVVMDEAHHVRNQNTLYAGVKAIHTNIIWMVTGTPVHNKESDLNAYWLLLNTSTDLLKTIYTSTRNILRRLIRHRVLRRTKDQVGIQLPSLTEEVVHVPWSDEFERDFSEQLHSQIAFSHIERNRITGAASFLTGNTLPALVRCRQACIRSQLMDSHIQVYREITEDHEVTNAPAVASKILAVVRKICKRRNEGRKLVFCHYHGEIDLLTTLLRSRGFSVCSIDGRIHTSIRMQYINDIRPDVLLTQINSGSEGLNLQAYPDIYVVSPHWNPAIDDQAIARAHRIGQTSPVHVHRFLMLPHSSQSLSLDTYAAHIQLLKKRIRPF